MKSFFFHFPVGSLVYSCWWVLLLGAAGTSCTPREAEGSQLSLARDTLSSSSGMVVCAHPLAAEVGSEILRQGGNAIDAAVGVQFALAVVLPWAGNIGGGGFLLSRQQDGTIHSLDFRESAPSAAHRDMFLDNNRMVIKNMSWYGHKASGVPGSVQGMYQAHDSLGRLPFASLIQPAIRLAREGVVLTEKEATRLNDKLPYIRAFSTQSNAFTSKIRWQAGDRIFMPDLAHTLSLIRDHGPAGFYEGKTADKIVEEMKRGGGLITHQDLHSYRAIWRPTISGTYRGHKVISMAPPSSGGVALIQLLKSIEAYPMKTYGPLSADAIHLMVEAERRVYADRAKHLGDMDFYPVPISTLLDSTYNADRMEDFDPQQATLSARIQSGEIPAESEQTTHFSIVDPEGNAVALTTTLNGYYGSCVLVGGAGFFLNNEMDDFSAKAGFPNAFGLLGAEANAIAPGKRMLSSMTPTILEKDSSLFMVVGSPGGSTIITSVFQTIVNVIDFDMDMQSAVNAPRFHHQWLPDVIQHEASTFTPEVQEVLSHFGHRFKQRQDPIGRVDAILILPNGRLQGGADPRGDDVIGQL
ncbi:MAG: gamma-glutamyltransferase [Bacteroidota bacterium]